MYCLTCGEPILPESARDDDPVKCDSCGADLGTHREIIDAACEAAKERFKADIDGTLNRLFWPRPEDHFENLVRELCGPPPGAQSGFRQQSYQSCLRKTLLVPHAQIGQLHYS